MNPLVSKNQQPTQAQQTARPNPMQLMEQFRQNPVGALRQAGYNVPDGMTDPRQIVNHLINNGQLGGSKLNQLRNMAQMFMRR